MSEQRNEELRAAAREVYGNIARSAGGSGCCGSGCGDASLELGYSAEELAAAPEGANMGLGCGNPGAIAGLREGETVLDLGAGGGFDCFLAARRVGPGGRVVGVDMTADMVSKARANATKLGVTNVSFRLGEIEHLPVNDASVDVILSNCVVNLSPDKRAVFGEAFRVLRGGGRLAIADVVATAALPAELEGDTRAVTACVGGAATVETVEELLGEAGFVSIRVSIEERSREVIRDWIPGSGIEDYVASATIEATKPVSSACCAPSCCGAES